jgi:hypothetical protein
VCKEEKKRRRRRRRRSNLISTANEYEITFGNDGGKTSSGTRW